MKDNRRVKILIIDDDATTLKTVSLYLKTKGFETTPAPNGRAGIDLFRKKKPDLLVIDLRMPEIDGFEVLERVKKESPGTPVVVVSGTDKISDAVKALRLGAWDYVLKPIQDMSVLLYSINRVLEKACLIKENKRYQESLELEIEKRTLELKTANRSLIEEIKERKRAEEALRESEQAYRAIFNSSTAALFITDGEGHIIEANSLAAKWYGYKQDSRKQKSIDDFLSPEDIPKLHRLFEKIGKENRCHKEIQTISQKGDVIICEVVINNVLFKGKDRRLVVFRDITERKKAEERERLHQQQLIQADKMASLGILVSGVAHEINNPNNFIMVNAPIAEKICSHVAPILHDHYLTKGDFYIAPRIKYSEMKDKLPDFITGILEGARRIDNYVKELKNFARPTTSTVIKKIDINSVIKSALTLTANMIKKSTRLFRVEYGENLPQTKGNFQRLEQVIINLVENSCQALPDKESGLFIKTRYNEKRDMIEIEIEDQGAGMDVETLKKITNPFFSTKKEWGGTGLGLSISSQIIEDHKGILGFESNPGKGTVATILLPAATPPPAGKPGKGRTEHE